MRKRLKKLDSNRPLGKKDYAQRSYAPKGDRVRLDSVAEIVGLRTKEAREDIWKKS